jgi:hypothetical protein
MGLPAQQPSDGISPQLSTRYNLIPGSVTHLTDLTKLGLPAGPVQTAFTANGFKGRYLQFAFGTGVNPDDPKTCAPGRELCAVNFAADIFRDAQSEQNVTNAVLADLASRATGIGDPSFNSLLPQVKAFEFTGGAYETLVFAWSDGSALLRISDNGHYPPGSISLQQREFVAAWVHEYALGLASPSPSAP